MKKLIWKQRLFSSKVEFFEEDQIVGELKEGFLKKEGEGFLNERKIEFVKASLFKQDTNVIDSLSGEPIGKVIFNGWRNEAEIRIGDRLLTWKYTDFFNTNWQILEDGHSIAEYKSSWLKGEIEVKENEEPLILTGFFVHSNFVKILVVMVVIMIVIFSN